MSSGEFSAYMKQTSVISKDKIICIRKVDTMHTPGLMFNNLRAIGCGCRSTEREEIFELHSPFQGIYITVCFKCTVKVQ
jgi:hypothetical protein